MKIAVVSTILGYPWGGADAVWTAAAEAAARRGDQLLLAISSLALPHPRVAALLAGGATLHLRPRKDVLPGRVARLRHAIGRRVPHETALVRDLRAFAPDLVVFSCGGTYDVAYEPEVLEWLRASAVPCRIIANWQRDLPALGGEDRDLVRPPLELAEQVFFLSHRNLAATRRHLLAPLPAASVVQIPLRGELLGELPWPAESGTLTLAAVGRLEPVKGLDLLLHALHHALGTAPGWRLMIYGRGPELGPLQRTAAQLGLGAHVAFPGHVADLRAIWVGAHLFVSPAIDEGVPMTIPEAMLLGRPVLATCVGGAEDWIKDDENGFLCPAPTLDLLAHSLHHAWARRADWRDFGTRAHAAATARYQPDDYLRVIA